MSPSRTMTADITKGERPASTCDDRPRPMAGTGERGERDTRGYLIARARLLPAASLSNTTAPSCRPQESMVRILTCIVAVLMLAPLAAQSPQAGRRVAITIDDGPVVNEMTDLGRFQRITNGLIGTFQAEKVPVTMFVNEVQLNVPGQRDARAAVLEQWLDAGFDLGNHTYSHASANQVAFERFADEIVKG